MGYVVLWIESLAVSLLWVALLMGIVRRLRWPWLRWALTLLVVIGPLGLYGSMVSFTALLRFDGRLPNVGWFYPSLVLLISYICGAIWLIRRALKRATEKNEPTSDWPVARLSVVFVSALVLHLITFSNMDNAVRHRLTILRAEAGAIASSLAPIRILDQDNAAVVYQQAIDFMAGRMHWPEQWAMWEESVLAGKSLDYDDPQLVEFLAAQEPIVRLLRAGAKRPACDFQRFYVEPSVDMLLPELQELRHATSVLALHAHYAATHDDISSALEDIQTMLRIAGHVAAEPLLVSHLISSATHNQAVRTLEDVLNARQVPADALEVLQLDDGTSYQRRIQLALRCEEAFGLSVFAEVDVRHDFLAWVTQIAGGLHGRSMSAPGSAAIYRVFMLADDLRKYREVIKHAQEIAGQPYHRVAVRWDEFGTRLKRDRGGIISSLMLPSLHTVVRTLMQADARHALARTAVALHRHRARTGSFPADLNKLVPADLAYLKHDPFTGKPLKYIVQEDGWVIYSVGPDQKDDQGAPLDDRQRNGDIAFRYNNP